MFPLLCSACAGGAGSLDFNGVFTLTGFGVKLLP